MTRRSYWGWGLETDEPTEEQRGAAAQRLSERHGKTFELPPRPSLDREKLREPRMKAPDALAGICSADAHERAAHSYGKSFRDRLRAFRGDFPNPPDIVAFPRGEGDVVALLEWCDANRYAAVPYGGG
jgi:alkyldihydroxyacetonephosphate synthase